ncbi:class I SAM-dependent methyltransferase [Myxococcota bacterium]|nr:class I SAM-dependent methyltransferase [Myxococcota bacterium]
MSQLFNVDTAALAQREALNHGAAQHDLEAWIRENVHLAAGHRVLDLGCGRGKQVFAFAPLVMPGGSIVGLDVSPEAAMEVRRRVAREDLRHIEMIECGLDDCVERLKGRVFDRILSTYAIYYSQDMVSLMLGLRLRLAPGGVALYSGFGRGSNREINEIIRHVAAGRTPGGANPDANLTADRAVDPVEDFITPGEIDRLADAYTSVRIVRLENRMTFASVEDVMRWWAHHNSYRPELATRVRAGVASVVEHAGAFTLSKHVLGVLVHA